MNIIGTGLSGLVGSRIVEILSSAWQFEDLSLATGIDITDHAMVLSRIGASSAPWVFHFAALTDVDGVEKERPLGQEGNAWKVNVVATGAIVDACRKTGKKLLYISTDYVFDGTKDEYSETDTPNPTGWYGVTKWEGEKRVQELKDAGVVIRIANPYRVRDAIKGDFVHKIVDRFVGNQPVSAPSDQIFVPTFVDDIAGALKTIVERNGSGVYHVVGRDALSPFQAAKVIAKVYGYPASLVSETTFAAFFKDRAPRPFHARLINDKIFQLGIQMSDFASGLEQVKRQDESLLKL